MTITLTPFNASLSTRFLHDSRRVDDTCRHLCGKHYGIGSGFFSACSSIPALATARKRALHRSALAA
jgi:hypothetical protein